MRDGAGSHSLEPSPEAKRALHFAGLILDLEACRLTRDSGEAIPLTRGELALLRMLVSRPGRVISRDSLLDAFTNRRFESFDRSVDVLIGKLRRKIEPDPKQPRLIVTVPGEGYRFDGLTQSFQSASTGSVRTARPARVEPRRVIERGGKPREDVIGATARPEALAVPRLSIVV